MKDALITLIVPILEQNPLEKFVSTTHQKWTAYLSENSMYLKYNNRVYKRHTSTRRPQYRVCTASNVTCFQPANIYKLQNGHLQVLGKSYLPTPEASLEPRDLMEFFSRAPDWQRRIWGTGNITEETLNVLVLHLMKDNVIAGGDGSVNNGQAAHAWCLAPKTDFTPIIEGAGPSDGVPTFLTSLRPETIACIAVASLLHLTTTAANIFDKEIPFYTDSLSVAQHAENSHWHATKHIYENDMDLILENNRLLKKLKVNLIPTHVSGHRSRIRCHFLPNKYASNNMGMYYQQMSITN